MSFFNPFHHSSSQSIHIRADNESKRLLTIPAGAVCHRCTSFRLNPSRCIIKHKEVNPYNRCEVFKPENV
jgi:hypothetical protein